MGLEEKKVNLISMIFTRVCSLFLLLFLCFLQEGLAKSSREQWQDLAAQLDSDSKKHDAASASLAQLPGLDALLSELIEKDKGHDFYLAMRTVMALHRESLLPKLLSSLDTIKPDEQIDLLHAISSLRNDENEETILKKLNEKYPLSDKNTSFVLRGVVADVYLQSTKTPPPEILIGLLQDDSFSLRVRAVNLASKRINEEKYLDVISSALEAKPFQVPLAAVRAIRSGDKSLLKKFHSALERCSNSEYQELKDSCVATLR